MSCVSYQTGKGVSYWHPFICFIHGKNKRFLVIY